MAGQLFVFAGPSLAESQLLNDGSVTMLPPCRQGDVYRATLKEPAALGIVDGYFEGVPSVWHKEILWALSQGVHVLGAASMGALRAAELDGFGMQGIGEIYQAYRDGTYEDDDEVALVHGPAEAGYVALSEPMVNVRQTLRRAKENGILSGASHDAFLAMAKEVHYKGRTWDAMLAGCADAGMTGAESAALKGWIGSNAVDQKCLDAELLCEAMLAPAMAEPFQPSFQFEVTEFWWRATREWQFEPRRAEMDERMSGGFRLLG